MKIEDIDASMQFYTIVMKEDENVLRLAGVFMLFGVQLVKTDWDSELKKLLNMGG